MRRAEVTSLHIEGLVVDQVPDKKKLHRLCVRLNMSSAEEERYAAGPLPDLHPDIRKPETVKFIQECKNLSRLIIDIKTDHANFYTSFLRFRLGLRTGIYLMDESHWILPLCCASDLPPFPPTARNSEAYLNHKDRFPDWAWGNKVRLEVEIIRDSEALLKKRIEPWAALY